MLMDKRLSKEVPVFTLLPRLEAKEKKYIRQVKLKIFYLIPTMYVLNKEMWA